MHSKKHFIANWKMNGLIKDLNHISRVSDYLKKIKKMILIAHSACHILY